MKIPKQEQLLLVAFCALAVVPLQYLFRGLDNNTLMSWQWIFRQDGILRPFLFVLIATGIAFYASSKELPERAPVPFLFVLSFLSAVPVWTEPEAIIDAGRYFLQAKHLELYGVLSFAREWGRGITAWTDLPAVPFLYGLVFRAFGESRTFIQAFTTLLFSFSVVLTFRIGERLWDRETGMAAGLFLLGVPYLIVQVPLMLIDVPVMFFLTLAMFTFIEAMEKGGAGRVLLASAALAAALFTKYSAGPMLLVLPLIAAVEWRRGRERLVTRAAGTLFGALAFTSPIILSRIDLMKSQIGLIRAYQIPGLSRWGESPASTYLFQIHPFITVLAVAGLIAALRKRDIRFAVLAWFAAFGVHVDRIRYLLPLFPLLALAGGAGLQGVREARVKRFVALTVAGASLALAYGAVLPFLQGISAANLAQAGRYLDTLPGECVTVRVLSQPDSSGNTLSALPILDLFTDKKLVYERRDILAPEEGFRALSPLRFTWEMPLPGFYAAGGPHDRCPIAVISGDIRETAGLQDGGLHLLRRFGVDAGTFRFKTFVTVYGRDGLSQTGHE